MSEEKQGIEFLKIPDSQEDFAEYTTRVNSKINEIIKIVNDLLKETTPENLGSYAMMAYNIDQDMKHGCFLEFHNKRSGKK